MDDIVPPPTHLPAHDLDILHDSANLDVVQKSLEEHKCYEILLTRKHVNKNMKFRITLVSDILKLSFRDYLSPELHDDIAVHSWHKVYSVVDKRKHKWSTTLLARALCEFDTILCNSKKFTPFELEQLPPAIQNYSRFMQEVDTAVDLEHNVSKRNAEKKVGVQKGFLRAQDGIDLSHSSIKSFDNSPCASAHCRHRCLLPTGMSPVEINDFNNKLKTDHKVAVQKW